MKKYNAKRVGFFGSKITVLSLTAVLFSAQLCFGLSVSSYATNTDGVTFTCSSEFCRSYEADAATLSGTAAVATDHSGYSGSGFAAGFVSSTTAQALFTVTAPSAGQYRVQLKYSAGNGASSNTGLYVNGSMIKTLSCPVTASWEIWATRTDTVTLNSGSNTIAYRATTSSTYCINLDNIVVTSNSGTGGSTSLMKVQICQPDIVHLTYTPTASFPSKTQLVVTATWPTPSFSTSDVGDTVTLQTSRLKAKVSRTTANVTYTDLSNNVVLAEAGKSMPSATIEGVSTYSVLTDFYSPADEGLYGLGQNMINGGSGTVIVNYKGNFQTVAQEYAVPANTFHNAIPVLMSTRGYGVYWDNYSKSWFYGGDAGNTQYRYISECGSMMDYYFFYGPELDTVVSKYRSATGKAPLFPKWCFGLIQSKDRYQSQAEFLAVKNGYRNNNIPLDCIVQDWHYWDGAGAMGCNCFNSNWTNIPAMMTECHNANIHTMLSIWSEVESGSALYTTLNTMGALWPSDGAFRFLDAYHTNGRETYWNSIRDALFIPHGWDGWWLDNDEPFPYPNSFNRHSLTTAMGTGCLYYNTYTTMLTKTGYANWRRDIAGKRCVILHRACFAGQQAHSGMTWNNDIPCNFGTMANSIPSGLNSTITGVPYWCTDIGGYWGNSVDFTTAANRELMTRWFQYGAFQPVFRIHGNCMSGQGKELYSTTWDATTRANLLLIDKLRYRLMPYLYSLGWMVTNNDYTPMRHLVMDFRTDANVKAIGNQYMFGPAFMVSPVTTQGATTRSVYLPAGTWYDFWTGATVAGGTSITASAPLNHIPLYIRAGSIVPMGPEIQYATQRADTIELRVYPGADGSFTLYEDEGDNYNYETGSYATIPMTYTNSTGKLHIGGRIGSFTGMLSSRVFAVVFVTSGHGSDEPKTAAPDCMVNYSGTGVTACPAVGICGECAAEKAVNPKTFSLKAAFERIDLPQEFSGKTKEIVLYACSGRLLQKAVTNKDAVNLRRDFGLPSGVYIVKVKVVR